MTTWFGMRYRHLAHAGLLAALGGLAITAAVAGMASPTFLSFDVNGDGTIALEEFQAQGGLVKAFHDGDANGDARLDKTELAQAMARNDKLMRGNPVDDAWLTARVKTMLLKDDIARGLSVNVETRKGMVQLSGWVDNEAQIAHAEQLARSVDGVTTVKNALQVTKR